MSKIKSGGPPSEKAVRILRSKSPLTEDEIAKLSEAEAWELIYAINPPKTSRTPKKYETCFTGFSEAEKVCLQQLATVHGLSVVKTVTKTLRFLVAGENAGPSKLQKAIDQEAIILNEEEFMRFLDDGTIPTEGI